MINKEVKIKNNKIFFIMDNELMALGIEHLLHDENIERDYVFFSSEYIYEAKRFSLKMPGVIFIMVYTKNRLTFIKDSFISYRLNAKCTLNMWKKTSSVIACIDSDYTNSSCLFSYRELILLGMALRCTDVKDIGDAMNLHYKTVYGIRTSIFKKLGCSNKNDFSLLVTSGILRKWFRLIVNDFDV